MTGKVTFNTVRKIAASIPDVEVSESPRGFSLKVHGKLLACEAIHKSAEPDTLLVRIDGDERESMIADAPNIYYVTDHYVNFPSVLVRLSRVDREALRDLLLASRRFVSASAGRKRTPNSRQASRRSRSRET
jgi:hypothetical protein